MPRANILPSGHAEQSVSIPDHLVAHIRWRSERPEPGDHRTGQSRIQLPHRQCRPAVHQPSLNKAGCVYGGRVMHHHGRVIAYPATIGVKVP